MTGQHIAALAALAVLGFWAVGAYNRLIGLRNDLARSLLPVQAQLAQRHDLLRKWAEAMSAVIGSDPKCKEPVVAACTQVQTAFEALCARPADAAAASLLRLAESVLSTTRHRLIVEAPARQPHLSRLQIEELGRQLAAIDATLGFAREQFNAAVLIYNRAVRQLPTGLISRTMGFGLAGLL